MQRSPAREPTRAGGGSAGIPVLLTLAATGIGLLETLLPRPMPFIKPGFANVVTVFAVLACGRGMAFRVNILRSFLVALASGTLATPSFLLSLGGGLASTAAMSMLVALVPTVLSVTGLSIAGSLASLGVQLVIAAAVVPGLPIRALVPAACIWGVLSGALVGMGAVLALRSDLPLFRRIRLVEDAEAG
jgi:heptaprenyl diphosphate synthase